MLGDSPDFFLFDSSLLTWLLLAFGAAMMVGNAAALIRPPEPDVESDEPPVPPSRGRLITLIVIGALATVWATATLLR